MGILAVTTRRGFLTGAIALLAAPSIVRAASLMPVKGIPAGVEQTTTNWLADGFKVGDIVQLDIEALLRHVETHRLLKEVARQNPRRFVVTAISKHGLDT